MSCHPPSRASHLPCALIALALLGLVPACRTPQVVAPAGGSRPNIVYILADDLGYGELGSYGQQLIATPHLDRLADQGMRFTQHYSGSPVCAPARCVLLTGLHTGHAAIRDNDELSDRGDVWRDPALEGQRPLPADTQTLGHHMQRAGYATAFIGKWGLGGPGSEGAPEHMGFDRFFGYLCQRQAHNYYPTHLWRDAEKVPLPNPGFFPHARLPEGADPHDPASYAEYGGEVHAVDPMIDEALGWLDERGDEPFLLVFASPIPHLSLQIPAEDLAVYDGVFDEPQPYVGDHGYTPHPTPRAAYAAMITRLDKDVGRLLDKLEAMGVADDTLVMFSSDNGPSWVGGVDLEYFESAGGLRGRKAQLFEGGIRVPLVARWPGHIPAGSTSDHISGFQDMLPTFCDVAGAPVPDGLDGLSMVPELTGDMAGQPHHDHLYWEHARRAQAARRGHWKAFRPRPDQAIQLYDLSVDPAEEHDVASEHPEVVEAFTQLFVDGRSTSEHFELIDG